MYQYVSIRSFLDLTIVGDVMLSGLWMARKWKTAEKVTILHLFILEITCVIKKKYQNTCTKNIDGREKSKEENQFISMQALLL